jgi:hypothetical protein
MHVRVLAIDDGKRAEKCLQVLTWILGSDVDDRAPVRSDLIAVAEHIRDRQRTEAFVIDAEWHDANSLARDAQDTDQGVLGPL